MFAHSSILWRRSNVVQQRSPNFSGLIFHIRYRVPVWIFYQLLPAVSESDIASNRNCDCKLRDSVPLLSQSATRLPAVLHYGLFRLLSEKKLVCLSGLWLISSCTIPWLEINPNSSRLRDWCISTLDVYPWCINVVFFLLSNLTPDSYAGNVSAHTKCLATYLWEQESAEHQSERWKIRCASAFNCMRGCQICSSPYASQK